jgi:hypothetical protein
VTPTWLPLLTAFSVAPPAVGVQEAVVVVGFVVVQVK